MRVPKSLSHDLLLLMIVRKRSRSLRYIPVIIKSSRLFRQKSSSLIIRKAPDHLIIAYSAKFESFLPLASLLNNDAATYYINEHQYSQLLYLQQCKHLDLYRLEYTEKYASSSFNLIRGAQGYVKPSRIRSIYSLLMIENSIGCGGIA